MCLNFGDNCDGSTSVRSLGVCGPLESTIQAPHAKAMHRNADRSETIASLKDELPPLSPPSHSRL